MKNGWRIPWNVSAICETFKISCLLRRYLVKGGSGVPSNGTVITCSAMVEYPLLSAKDLSRLHQFGLEVLPGTFPPESFAVSFFVLAIT